MGKSNEGFTLIEVVVALGVLSFGILAMLVMQTTGVKGNASAQRITAEVVQASDLMEVLMGINIGEYPFDGTACTLAELKNKKIISDAVFASLSNNYTVTCAVVKDSPKANMYETTISVTQKNSNGPAVELSHINIKLLNQD